jgi:diguanylate cyclase (GGDEF)-like protein
MRALLPMLVFIAIALGAAAGPASGAAPDTIAVLPRAQVLRPSADCGGTLARIARLPDACFVPGPALQARGTGTFWSPVTIWLRFSASELRFPGRPWLLIVSTYALDGELAVIDRGRTTIATEQFGSLIPVARRRIFSGDLRVPLPDPVPAGAVIVVRLTGIYTVPDILQLQTVASVAAGDRAALAAVSLPFAFLNGGALTLALFNLVLCVLLRRSIYLMYAGAIAALVFYQVAESGAAWTVLWPQWSVRGEIPVYGSWVLYVALIVAFTRRMLDLRRIAPLFDRLVVIAFGAVVVDSIVNFAIPDVLLELGIYNWLDPLVTAVMVGTMLAAGVVAWRRGVSGAPAYVVAFAGSAIGIVISDVASYMPSLGATAALAFLPLAGGVAWESVFLAAALAQRVRETERAAARLSEFAFTDGLTGIANRRAFDEAIEREWSRLQRIGGTMAIAIFDIDHFKAFNDRYGHPAGDARLITVARLIAAAARREGDLAARYGGEEFALLLPNTTLEGAFAIAEAVRERVATETGEMELTISAGVAAAFAPSDALTIEALLVSADVALYAAKSGGRNRTERSKATPFGEAPATVSGGS